MSNTITGDATKSKKKPEPKPKPEPTLRCQQAPRRYRLPSGKWVGIGGPIRIVPTGPNKAYTIPEATDDELREIENPILVNKP